MGDLMEWARGKIKQDVKNDAAAPHVDLGTVSDVVIEEAKDLGCFSSG